MLVITAKKRAFNATANYTISMITQEKQKQVDFVLGKLRANKERDKFTLYDHGVNFSKKNSYTMDQIRIEHGQFFFRYEPCHVGNIRKMIVLLPSIYPQT
jgi:hypothetical protein